MEKKNYDKVIKGLQIAALVFMACMVVAMLVVPKSRPTCLLVGILLDFGSITLTLT